jgi:outer membrane cobalamin receptor
MTAKSGILFCLLLMCQWICAQNDSITRLKEVIVSDVQLKQFSTTQSVLLLNDSIIRRNQPSLTALLNYNSVIYFKENGLGMVSSPSFRGTTAQQTAVIWNGLNINSQFNGQTDFNTITAKDFNSVSVRAGGGSVIYGSSAIGGSVHLNNELEFRQQFENTVEADYGSFNTLGLHYNLKAATKKVSIQMGISRNSSDNDYDFLDSDRKNTNGQYYNTSANAGFGYKINRNNSVIFYGYAFDGERHFSLISPSDTKTKYHDFNTRNLLEWTNIHNRLTSKIKAAFLTEKYEYYGSLASTPSNYAKAETVIAKYDAAYQFSKKILLNAVVDFSQTKSVGSDVGDNRRQIGSVTLLLKHQVLEKLGYEIGLRKEATSSYDSPFLFSAGANYELNKYYTVKANASRNFRIPTFNDLYWLDGGNPDLKPESSFQAEIGNDITYKSLTFSVTGYFINIEDMIQWQPGTSAMWHPVNVNKVKTYGIETILGWHKKYGKHDFAINGTYAYTVSKNRKTGYQLIYVPYHKVTGALAYSWKKFTADYQILFNGEVFTRSDNNPRYNIDAYSVSNLGAGYGFGKDDQLCFGVRVQNLFNENYRVVEGRPFPGRNYNLYLTLKF